MLKDEKLYRLTGEPIIADDSGLISVVVDGITKRFVPVIFIKWVKAQPQFQPVTKQPKKVKLPLAVKPKKKKRKKKVVVKRDYKWQRKKEAVRRGISITVEKEGEVFGPFISLRECARELRISTNSVSRGLQGAKCHGYKLIPNDRLQIPLAGVSSCKEKTA